jgi:hypothetical protein
VLQLRLGCGHLLPLRPPPVSLCLDRLEAEDGRLRRLEPLEEPFALEFSPPPLATLTLRLTRDPLIPLEAGNGLALGWDGFCL